MKHLLVLFIFLTCLNKVFTQNEGGTTERPVGDGTSANGTDIENNSTTTTTTTTTTTNRPDRNDYRDDRRDDRYRRDRYRKDSYGYRSDRLDDDRDRRDRYRNGTRDDNRNRRVRIRQNLNVGNPDSGDIRRPCRVYDYNCVRDYLARHSECKKTYGSVPDPIYRKRVLTFVPSVNVTQTLINLKKTGLNGRIEEFYVNYDTDKLVIAIEYNNITLSSDLVYFRYHRRGKEPVITKGDASITYESLIVTAVIPQLKNLRLDKAVATAYVNDRNPRVTISPSLGESTDPQVPVAFSALLANLNVVIAETLLSNAAYFSVSFIQYILCDFGVINL